MLHSIRLRPESFRSICPDPADAFAAWWRGNLPASGRTSTFIVLDPAATGRQRAFIDLEEALSARPRHSGYADAAADDHSRHDTARLAELRWVADDQLRKHAASRLAAADR